MTEAQYPADEVQPAQPSQGTEEQSLEVRVKAMLEGTQPFDREAIRDYVLRTEQERETYRKLSERDPLTGAYNRRKFEHDLEATAHKADRIHFDFSLIYIDLDFLKQINDGPGNHADGDTALRTVTGVAHKMLRDYDSDHLYRIGGDEFAIILEGTDLSQGVAIAERLKQAINEAKLSVSMGVSNYKGVADSTIGLVQSADRALYKAKEQGRNKVVAAEPLLD